MLATTTRMICEPRLSHGGRWWHRCGPGRFGVRLAGTHRRCHCSDDDDYYGAAGDPWSARSAGRNRGSRPARCAGCAGCAGCGRPSGSARPGWCAGSVWITGRDWAERRSRSAGCDWWAGTGGGDRSARATGGERSAGQPWIDGRDRAGGADRAGGVRVPDRVRGGHRRSPSTQPGGRTDHAGVRGDRDGNTGPVACRIWYYRPGDERRTRVRSSRCCRADGRTVDWMGGA